MGYERHCPEGGESRRIGSEGAVDELGEHFSCSGVMLGRLEVQGYRKRPVILTGRAAEQSMLSCLDFLLTPSTKSWVWAVPIGVSREVEADSFIWKR